MKHLKHITLLCLLMNSCQLTFACSDQMDYTALRALYLNTDGDNWSDNTGWPDANFFNMNPTIPSSTDMSTWNGLTCINGKIIYIYLPNNNLNGSLPSEIGLLSELVEINVNDNQMISGALPIELWNLSNLNRLYMWNTDVSGSIPSAISGLVSLEEIVLTYNQMSGPLPIELTQLPNLYSIQLCGTGLTGTMPASIYNMSQLITLNLCDNNLNIGQLSSSISNLSNLEHFDIGGGNMFTGTIPLELWDLPNLRFIGLSGGSLTGQIPPAIGNLINLETLLLDDNNMSGSLPQEMKDLVNMFWISLTNNSFSGTIDDDFFDKWIQIHDVRFSSNQFTGDLPSSLGNRTSLRVVTFDNNQFSGCFPYNYKNLCTNKNNIPNTVYDFSVNSGLGSNNGDFDAFCNSDAGLCAATVDCHWIELTISTGSGPMNFSYSVTPFDYNCNGGSMTAGEYSLDESAPNTTLTYVLELDENWYNISIVNDQYNGSDLTQTIEIKELSTSNVIVPQSPIQSYFYSDVFPICSAAITNQNLTVTNNNDSGPGSLRQAITDSNCSYGKDEINILTTGTINLTTCDLSINGGDCFIILPSINDDVCIFGNGITITSNTTGRLFNSGAALLIKDLTIDNINYSTFQGGTGGAIWNGNDLTLENVTFSNNHTASAGGAIYSFGDIDMVNCTFSNNSSGDRGGAMVLKNGSCKINHSTFTDNTSTEGAAIYTWPNFPLEIENSIIANNYGDADLNLNNALVTNNTNLVGACVGACPTFFSMADPQLGPLQDNGGVTYTHALQAGSPAIDVLNIGSIVLDQRGYDIFNGEKDLGAYEFGGVDVDGCDIVEFEQTDIIGNTEEVMAHLMVGGDNTIDMNADVLYQASELIDLKPGFQVSQGSIFEAQIGPCTTTNSFVTILNPVTSPMTGKIWMDRNLGAVQAATSSTDSDSYGYLYQWGRSSDGHQERTSGTTSTLSPTDNPGNGFYILGQGSPNDWRTTPNPNLWQGANGINNPCPSGYRLPTDVELDAEVQTWSSSNAAGAYASPLKLPKSGYRSDSNGAVISNGSSGCYWTSTIGSSNSSRGLHFTNTSVGIGNNARAYGFAVRCIKN